MAHRRSRRRLLIWPLLRRDGPFLLVLVLAAWLLTINVAAPWQSIHEDNGVFFQMVALNHIRFGLGVTKGQDLYFRGVQVSPSYGPTDRGEAGDFASLLSDTAPPTVYGHHPPALGLTAAASFLAFGYHYWAERLVPIGFALGGLIVFYLLALRVFDIAIARSAAAIFATYPIFAYYGRQVSHESEVLLFALLLMYGYASWREDPSRRWLVLMGASVVLGGLYDWPMYYFAAILFVADWVARRRPSKPLALATLAPAAIVLAAVIAQIAWTLGWHLDELARIFAKRTSGGSDLGPDAGVGHVSTLDWFSRLWGYDAAMFGSWTQFLLPVGAVFIAGRSSAEGWSRRVLVVVTLGAWGLSHILIFRNGAYAHDYWQFYLIPFFALATAWMVVTVARQTIGGARQRAMALLVMLFVVFCMNLPTIEYYYGTNNQGQRVNPLIQIDLWR